MTDDVKEIINEAKNKCASFTAGRVTTDVIVCYNYISGDCVLPPECHVNCNMSGKPCYIYKNNKTGKWEL
jgi:hypothetical protein